VGELHYFVVGGQDHGGGLGGDGSSGSQITNWVESRFMSTTVGGATVDDLTSAAS
jgi:hypothetical protein